MPALGTACAGWYHPVHVAAFVARGLSPVHDWWQGGLQATNARAITRLLIYLRFAEAIAMIFNGNEVVPVRATIKRCVNEKGGAL